MAATTTTLDGRTVAVTAERRSEEQMSLLTARGATVVHAPTVHTVDLTGDEVLRAHTDAVIADPPDVVVATTGFGMRLWFDVAAEWGVEDRLLEALARSTVVARGPKARSACRQRGLHVAWTAPGESMPEVVEWVSAVGGIDSASVAVQLFDPEDHPTSARLRTVVGDLREIPVYRWELPSDTAPVHALVDAIVAGEVDAVTFTSQPAVRFLLDVAGGRADDVVAACNDGRVLPVCIGPVCAEAGVAAGITTMVWPEPFRLVPMVKLVAEVLGP